MLPKRVINNRSKDLFVSQYDRIRNKNGGFNKNPKKKFYRFARVDGSNLKYASTRAALFKLADKLPDSWYKHELLKIAQNTQRHEMSYGVFLVRKHIKPNFTPYGVEYVLSSWFKAIPGPYEWWYQITIVKDKKYDQVWHHDNIPILRIKDK